MLESRYYKTSSRMPAYEYIKKQDDISVDRITKEMERLDKYGLDFALRDRTVKKIHPHPIYELRVKVGRLKHRLLFTIKEQILWYVSGFMKKTSKTPKNEIDTAVKRAKEIC